LNLPHQGTSPRILVAGLSPAWQQIVVVDEFQSGEVNRAREVHWCASGKVLNVGIALAHMSHNTEVAFRSRVLSMIGPRCRAAVEPEFACLGVAYRWIETTAETRICTTILDQATGHTTELVENAAPITSNEADRFCEAFREEAATADIVVFTGSLPPGFSPTLVGDLLRETKGHSVLDIRGAELFDALQCRPLCVKPNREELEKTLDRKLNTEADLHAAMRELNEQGAGWVVITHGAGAVWASHANHLYRFRPPRVERVVNPIASGDCLAAGIAWATACGNNMLDAIRIGIAAAADNVGQLLPARLDRARMALFEEQVVVDEW
jgi:1-phosphofructokinase family hexose kinase